MKQTILFLALTIIFSLNSCKDKNTPAPEPNEETLSPVFSIYNFKGTGLRSGIVMRDSLQKEIVFASGNHNSNGELISVDQMVAYVPKIQTFINYKFNKENIVESVTTTSKTSSKTFEFYDLNTSIKNVKVRIIDNSTGVKIFEDRNLPVSDETIELIQEAMRVGKELANARTSAVECFLVPYLVRFSIAYVTCWLTTRVQSEICTAPQGAENLEMFQDCKSVTNETAIPNCEIANKYYTDIKYKRYCKEMPTDEEWEEHMNCLKNSTSPSLTWKEAEDARFKCMDDLMKKVEEREKENEEEEEDDNEETGESWGDPHLITFDGLKYDFQAWGEFVAVKSTTDNFEVQVRYSGTKGGVFSFNAGVAVQTGEDLISKTGEGLFINNKPQNLDFTTIPLKGGAMVSYDRSTGKVKVKSKWGDIVNIAGVRPKIKLDKSRKGKVVGLFGNYDGNPKNDLLLRDSKSIDISDLKEDNFSLILPYDRIYPVLPTAWRITQAGSLFHYKAGENTNTYTVLDYPSRGRTLTEESVETARKACIDRGVTNEPYLSSCIFDVATTGSLDWINESLEAQNNSRKSSIVQLTTYSDISHYPTMRVTVSEAQAVLDDSCLVDYRSGKVYQLKDGAKYAQHIDGLFLTYCGIHLYTPQTIITCGYSCGVSRTNTLIKEQKWPIYRKGAIEHLGFPKDDDPTHPDKIAAEMFDQIGSASDIDELFKTGANNLTPDHDFTSTSITAATLACVPDILLGRTLRRFVTQDGKRGIIRIKNWGKNNGKYLIEFDVKTQK